MLYKRNKMLYTIFLPTSDESLRPLPEFPSGSEGEAAHAPLLHGLQLCGRGQFRRDPGAAAVHGPSSVPRETRQVLGR